MTSPRIINANPLTFVAAGAAIGGELVSQYPTVSGQSVGLVLPSQGGSLMTAEIVTGLFVSVTRTHLGGTDVELTAQVLNAAGEPIANAAVLFAIRATSTLVTHSSGLVGTSYWVSHAAGVGVLETMGGLSLTDGSGLASIIAGVGVAAQTGDVLAAVLIPGTGGGTLQFSFDP